MTRVGPLLGGTTPAQRAPRAVGFSVRGDAAEPHTTASAAAATPASFLALQDTAPPHPDPRRAHRQASVALDELRGLQMDLLAGIADRARLARLAALASALPTTTDPTLREGMAAIALRARLELARRRAPPASQP